MGLKLTCPHTITWKWPSSRQEEERDLFSLEAAVCWVKITGLNLKNSGWLHRTLQGCGIQSQHDGCVQLCHTCAVRSCQGTAVLLVCFWWEGPRALVWVMSCLAHTETGTKNYSGCFQQHRLLQTHPIWPSTTAPAFHKIWRHIQHPALISEVSSSPTLGHPQGYF